MDTCIDFSESAIKQGEEFMKQPCSIDGAVYGATACPKDKVIATCQTTSKSLVRYYGGGKKKFTVDIAKQQCTKIYSGNLL
jgi:hypothetical protein